MTEEVKQYKYEEQEKKDHKLMHYLRSKLYFVVVR